MPIGEFIKNMITGKGGELVKNIGEAVDNLTISKEEKEQFKIEAQKMALDHEQKMAEAATRQLEIELKDMADARNREIQIATSEHATKFAKNILPIMAVSVTIGFFAILLYMMKWEVPKENERTLDIMLGSLGTAWIGIIFYYFGSSQGSAQKQKQIEKMAG